VRDNRKSATLGDVYGLPICSECAKGIIQVGIKKVVIEKSKELDNWNDSVKLSKAMFPSCC
jgi:dCMP deaminase